ncbi:heterokaryon incompatibility [Fusarium beomiforme]|uniref:Heterokaryon incompatibility n=1 Tax=Fusarium beomiforme TaxID=44412 RepID=A0A9P5DSS2_9HYPO|nr:heterokaryon incompatibility [Fusarium beomiforme]
MDPSDYIGRVGWYRYREADGNSAPHLLWFRIVEVYTASALTIPSDKLIVCSGIAKRMAEIVQDDYVAGMWCRYLEGELLWLVQGNHQAGRWTRPKEYRAPSWSWASIDGPITPGEPRIQDSLIMVEDYHLDYWTSDKAAAIRGGWLRIRGVLKKTTLERKSPTPGGGYHWDMMLDNERVNVLEETSPGNTEPRVMLDILQEDFKEENTKGLLFSMCARSKTGEGRGMYILLFKMIEGETGTFRRISIAYAWSEKVKERILASSAREPKLPWLEYRDGLHSICII